MNRFVHNMSLSRFSPRWKLIKWAKFTFLKFFQALELWPTLFGQKTENHSTKTVVGSNILSYKSHVFSSSSTSEKKIVRPTSLKQLNVTFLFENGAKTCRWVKHTFLQKSSFFEFFSIWEENCEADIINRTINCDLFVAKWCKDVSLGQAYLPTKVVFFRVLQHLRRKLCGRHH